MAAAHRTEPEPFEIDNSRIVAVLTTAWLLALLVLAVAAMLGSGVRGWWLGMCGYGVVLGVAGLRTLARRKAATRRRAGTGQVASPGS